jgi:antitoxin (DNA-binding transcriptional repressor) of toxin-antitoxin stability system
VRSTATEFRKNLFDLLGRALRGETVEITYKNSTLKLVPSEPASKLARAKRQHALLVDPEAIVQSDAELVAGMEAAWRKDRDKM